MMDAPTMDWSLARALACGAAMVLGTWLIEAGRAKQQHWLAWWQALGHYRILPAAWRTPFAECLPWLEISVGAALWVPVLNQAALLVCMLMMLGFAVAIAVNVAAGMTQFDCGCTPGKRSPNAWILLARALLLAAIAGALAATLFAAGAPPLWLHGVLAVALGLGAMIRLAWHSVQAQAARSA